MGDRIKRGRGLRRSGSWLGLVALVMGLQVVAAVPAGAVSTDILISEVRTRGSAGGTDELVELYNASAAAVDISGWKLNRSSAGGSVNLVTTVPASTSIGAGCHYLLANNDYDDAVAEDQAWGTTGISNDGGIAILTGANVVVDQVGFGAGSAYKEGTPLAALTTNTDQSYERGPGGASGHGTDTDNNAADFSLIASAPENASSTCHSTGVASPQTLDVAVDGNGTGTVSSDPTGIACPGDCTEDYDEGTLVTLTAAADSGSWFERWDATGPCAGEDATCVVTMSVARSVTATFSLPTFVDVPLDHPFFVHVERIFDANVTSGCSFNAETGERFYCPTANVNRGQMAKFLMIADGQTELLSPEPTFADVPTDHTFYGWIERAFEQGVTSGCATDPLRYCPSNLVTRGQMARLLMVADGQTELLSPEPTFADVPTDHTFYGWIERAFEQGVTSGCASDPLRYCPGNTVNRGAMAKFLALTFDL